VSVDLQLHLWHMPNCLSGEAFIAISTADQDWLIFQLLIQMDWEMSKLNFIQSYCLTWYHAMDGQILLRSVLLWNYIPWTQLTTGLCGSYHHTSVEMAWCDCDNTIISNIAITSNFLHPDPRRQPSSNCTVLSISRSHWSINSLSHVRCTVDDLEIDLWIQLIQTFTITSLLHMCDHTLYDWIQVDIIQVCISEESHIFRRSHLCFGRGVFNPYPE
jgi:hypothetical protein